MATEMGPRGTQREAFGTPDGWKAIVQGFIHSLLASSSHEPSNGKVGRAHRGGWRGNKGARPGMSLWGATVQSEENHGSEEGTRDQTIH